MAAPVFALLIDAEAESGCEFPAGERHHLIVLVPAHTAEDATTEAMLALSDCKWTQGEVRQVERFGVPLATVADPVLRDAAEKAFAGNRSIIVYGKP